METRTRHNACLGLPAALLVSVLSAACKPEPGDSTGATETTGGTTLGTSGPVTDSGSPTTTGGPDGGDVAIVVNRDVDILFVIDNSGSMAEEQETLSANASALFNALEEAGANYRIGFTTTDSGNPRCPASDTTPEGGKLVLSSCVDRVNAGEFTLELQMLDFADTCFNYCDLDDSALTDKIKPTTTQYSNGAAAPRKWIESFAGTTNLPDGVSPVDAFQCFAPQGVSGCGFESHLESMYLALAQSSSAQSATNYGFLRDTAVLAVVFLSDEVDCSYKQEFKEIFTTNKTFWEDPNGPASTSAVCWNAGVKCEGTGPVYPECWAANYGLDGQSDVSDDNAVLQPLAKYVNFVQSIENQKKQYDPSQEVLVALFTGVPVGYENGGTTIVYEGAADPSFQDDFGIGPGCTYTPMGAVDTQTALPPVRAREFAEAFQVGDDPLMFSICQSDYSNPLAAIGAQIRDRFQPACMPKCVKDTDPNTPPVEPNCQLFDDNFIEGTNVEISRCELVGGAYAPPPGEPVCFAERVDPDGLTPSDLDDMSAACVAEGYNLEFHIVRTSPAPAGSTIRAVCELSPNKAKDCPNL